MHFFFFFGYSNLLLIRFLLKRIMLLRVVEDSQSFLQLCQVTDKEVFPGVCQQI